MLAAWYNKLYVTEARGDTGAFVAAYLGKLIAKLRKEIAVRTDERMRLMNEIVSGIQVIKMYAWEKPFAKLVAAARW
jgi:hypothetical protein